MTDDLIISEKYHVSLPEVIIKNSHGFTVYKIVLEIKNSNNKYRVETWRRYSSILKFSKNLLRSDLLIEIPEPLPTLVKPSLINRFNKEVVESRRKSALDFFQFCAKYAALYDSALFRSFFQDDYDEGEKRLFLRKYKRRGIDARDGGGASSVTLPEAMPRGGGAEALRDCRRSRGSPSPARSILPAGPFKALLRSPLHQPKQLSSRRSSDKGSPKKSRSLRHKPSEYLRKAEKFISRFSFRDSKTPSGCVASRARAAEEMMKYPFAYMVNYEVLGTAGDVIVACDVDTNETVAIKVIEKSGCGSRKSLVLPLNVPFMVPLIRFHENDFAIYLVMKFVGGGKLWNHLRKFMKRPSVYSNLNSIADKACKYEGQRLICEISGKDIEPCPKICMESVDNNHGDIPLITAYVANKQSAVLADETAAELLEELGNISELKNVSNSNKIAASIPKTNDIMLDAIFSERCVTECKSAADDYVSFFSGRDRRNGRSCSAEDDVWAGSRPESVEPSNASRPLNAKSYKRRRRKKIRKCKSLNDVTCQKQSIVYNEDKAETITEAVSSNFFSAQDKTLLNSADSDSAAGSDTLSGLSNDFSFSSGSITNYCSPDPSFNPENGKSSYASAKDGVQDLIRDSRKLLADVTKTLERSKLHSRTTLSSIRDTTENSYVTVSEMTSRRSSATIFESLKDSSSDVDSDVFQSPTDPSGDYLVRLSSAAAEVCQRNQDNRSDADVPRSFKTPPQSSVPCPAQTLRSCVGVARSEDRDSRCHDLKSCVPESRDRGSSDGSGGSTPTLSRNKAGLPAADSSSSAASLSLSVRPSVEPYQPMSARLTFDDQYIPEGLIKVWISQVISAMENLHHQGVVWGHFGPSNLLLDEGGSVLVTYRYSRETPALVGGRGGGAFAASFRDAWLSSLGYPAPEIMNPVTAAGPASDWWSVGALLFHLLNGKDVASCHPNGIYSHTQIQCVAPVSEEASSLIASLLVFDWCERLGSGPSGVQEIKSHPFFYGLEWL